MNFWPMKPDRMTQAEARSYRGSIERAAREHETRRAEHDRSGIHEWLDVTHLKSVEQEFICHYCSATKTEPFESRRDL